MGADREANTFGQQVRGEAEIVRKRQACRWALTSRKQPLGGGAL
jgi:hypothetical protein